MARKTMGLGKRIARNAKRKATNATKQMMYYAIWHEEMPANKRIVKSPISGK